VTAAAGVSNDEGAGPNPNAGIEETHGPLARDRFRKAISKAVSESWNTMPHFSVTREMSARGLVGRLEEVRRNTPEATLTDMLLAAILQATSSNPALKSDTVGLAVDTPLGVAVAVLTELDKADISQIVAKRSFAVRRMQEVRFAPEDLNVVPSLTLSNLGTHGVDSFTGIIPRGQVMLLAVGAIRDRQSVVDGLTGPSFFATATADHRALDGADVARFLQALTIASA
jgi:pyruvate dehydrogenase E2 component (dihydrolipoamide acetyltransferase)